MNALELSAVRKSLHGVEILRGLSLSVAAGEIVSLLGASGSGKTTLLRVVAGLERLDSGSVRIAGQLVDAPGTAALAPEQRGLGMVFQDYALWPHLSALDNVALALRARAQRDAVAQARDMLRRVGLDGMQQRRPHELSGGQQQRVALARALAVRPRLLLCDEPLSNLDSGLREELRELIDAVVREHGLSALYITHDQREAFALGDRVGILSAGTLLQIDEPHRLLLEPANEQVARFLHALGPWPLHEHGGALHAPWGELAPVAPAARGATRLYLPQAALRIDASAGGTGEAGPCGPFSMRAAARVLRCVPTLEGVELQAMLHGVAVRLLTQARHAPGSEVRLCLDARQALLFGDTAQRAPAPAAPGGSATASESAGDSATSTETAKEMVVR